MKEDNTSEISEIWRTDEKEELQRVKEEVEGWFDRAKRVHCSGINLYYSPYNAYFHIISKPVTVYGIATSMITYQGGLYETRSGSGDCEQNLWYLGECKEERR